MSQNDKPEKERPEHPERKHEDNDDRGRDVKPPRPHGTPASGRWSR
jgi:hypothetical protein